MVISASLPNLLLEYGGAAMILFSVFSLYIIPVSNPIRQRSNSDIQLMKRRVVLSIYITEPSEGPIVIEHASTDLLTIYVEKFTLISW